MTIISPLKTEKAIKLIEEQNTLTFEVDLPSTKHTVAKEIEKLFNVKVDAVRVAITSKGKKVAYVKLNKANKADDVAIKLKMVA